MAYSGRLGLTAATTSPLRRPRPGRLPFSRQPAVDDFGEGAAGLERGALACCTRDHLDHVTGGEELERAGVAIGDPHGEAAGSCDELRLRGRRPIAQQRLAVLE